MTVLLALKQQQSSHCYRPYREPLHTKKQLELLWLQLKLLCVQQDAKKHKAFFITELGRLTEQAVREKPIAEVIEAV